MTTQADTKKTYVLDGCAGYLGYPFEKSRNCDS